MIEQGEFSFDAPSLYDLYRSKDVVGLLKVIREMVVDQDAEINTPENAYVLLAPELVDAEQEHLIVLNLNVRNKVIEKTEVYKGSLNSSFIRIAEIFKQAVRLNAASIILAHNHPSGDPSPSPEDISITKQVCQAGRLLDVQVLDHLILGKGRFTSLKAKGLME